MLRPLLAILGVLLATQAQAQNTNPSTLGHYLPDIMAPQDPSQFIARENALRREINANFLLNDYSSANVGDTYYAINFTDPATLKPCAWEDPTKDVGPCVNAAIAAAALGGTVKLPAGSFGLATTIAVPSTQSNVAIEGSGGGGSFLKCGTTLSWIGAINGTMVRVGDDSSYAIGNKVNNFCLFGNLLAGIGLDMVSWNRGYASDIFVYNTTQHAIRTRITASNAAAFGDSRFERLKVTINSGSSNGITWAREDVLNRDIHETTWEDISVDVFSGIAFDCYSSDTNTISRARFNTTDAAGTAAIFHGATSGLLNWCRKNTMINTVFGLGTGAGLVLEGTDTPGITRASQGNVIWGYKFGDGELAPVMGTGATLYGFDTSGRRIPGSSPWILQVDAPVQSYSTSRTLEFNDCGKNIDNQGAAGAVVLTLPPAIGGYCTYRVTRYTGQQVTLQAGAGDFIRSAGASGSSSAAGAVASNSPFSVITIQDENTNNWVVKDVTGTWINDLGGRMGYTAGALATATPPDPTGSTSAAGVMMGISTATANAIITPTRSGTVLLTYSGSFSNSAAGDGLNVRLYTGTGTPPVNGAAITGTRCGANPGTRLSGGGVLASARYPFSITCVVQNAALNTPLWTDAVVAKIDNGGGGTANIFDLTVAATEQ